MNRTLSRLAASVSKKPLTSPGAPPTKVVKLSDQLLPATQLYRRLLRVHRKVLPIEMRLMGDDYVKAEFRRTRTTENPLHIVGFLSEWKKYLDFHEGQLAEDAAGSAEAEGGAVRERRLGQKLDPELFEKLSSEQIGQLYELMQATKEVWDDPALTKESEGGIPAGEVLPDLAASHLPKA
ncbi:hypothetical protein RQP46_003175 [Phenoliferia psychrophenolica]